MRSVCMGLYALRRERENSDARVIFLCSDDKMASPEGTVDRLQIEGQIARDSVAEFNLIISHVIGDKKMPPKAIPIHGIPQLPRTREELLVHAVFESCAFKSAASCVIG